eukprot:CAMPEP_0185688968 /NCGR_PEP_ID=MMETSP1164-20130828/172_1 /TAXON_ID=1104430 /ORGANISM="Chrysoreinhardia sp, Strain CCMP2950" /LENGTH=178 /DNA_ID=CAMNT_0028355443 /DNA_START=21 /DNA_END=557 /DNA_ORIENTATION=-
MALRKFQQQVAVSEGPKALALYRKICREMPTILTIYDVDMSLAEARSVVRSKIAANAHVTDPRIIEVLCEKGYMELDEAMLQYKTPAQLMSFLDQTTLMSDKEKRALKDPLTAMIMGLKKPEDLTDEEIEMMRDTSDTGWTKKMGLPLEEDDDDDDADIRAALFGDDDDDDKEKKARS